MLVTATCIRHLNLNANGAFTYMPTNSYTGADSFAYRASNGVTSSAPATVNLNVTRPGEFFSDDFNRTVHRSDRTLDTAVRHWTMTNGVLAGASAGIVMAMLITTIHLDRLHGAGTVAVLFDQRLGRGLGGRLDPVSGAHYAAWIYPEGSVGGSIGVEVDQV